MPLTDDQTAVMMRVCNGRTSWRTLTEDCGKMGQTAIFETQPA